MRGKLVLGRMLLLLLLLLLLVGLLLLRVWVLLWLWKRLFLPLVRRHCVVLRRKRWQRLLLLLV